jgi:hypothetical protein
MKFFLDVIITLISAAAVSGLCVSLCFIPLVMSFDPPDYDVLKCLSLWLPEIVVVALLACIFGRAAAKSKLLPSSSASFAIAFVTGFILYIISFICGYAALGFGLLLEPELASWVNTESFQYRLPKIVCIAATTSFFIEVTQAAIVWSFVKPKASLLVKGIISRNAILLSCVSISVAATAFFILFQALTYTSQGFLAFGKELSRISEGEITFDPDDAELEPYDLVSMLREMCIVHASSSIIVACGYARSIGNKINITIGGNSEKSKKNAIFSWNLLVAVSMTCIVNCLRAMVLPLCNGGWVEIVCRGSICFVAI